MNEEDIKSCHDALMRAIEEEKRRWTGVTYGASG